MNKKNFITFIFVCFTASMSNAFAYSNFIAYGYTSCVTCHYNALGGGPINDYGRAVSAVAISSNVLWSKSVSDNSLGEASGFLFSKPSNTWFRPAISARGLKYYTNYFTGKAESRFILMQAEANAVVKLFKDKLIFSGTYGYAPKPAAYKNSKEEISYYISREHYAMLEVSRGHRVSVGLMDKAFGLRVPDHIAFSRNMTGLAQNDQSYGAIYNYLGKNFETAVEYFVGNFNQDAPLRQKGFSATGEYEVYSKFRVGASVLKSSNEFLDRKMGSLMARFGTGEGGSVISETGLINSAPINSEVAPKTGAYNFTQTQMRLSRGMHFLTTFEFYRPDIEASSNKSYRYGVGLQYFPVQRIELRADLVNSRVYTSSTVGDDTWSLQCQLHLWL